MGRAAVLLERPAAEPQFIPPLQNGDRLTAEEFHRRYEAMPEDVKAELIEGVVYLSSPVRAEMHGEQTSDLIAWLRVYAAYTPGTRVADNSTVRLGTLSEPQPDVFLRILPDHGGQAHTRGGYVVGAPEFIAEVAASTASIDLHDKLHAYRRNRVREYLVWRVEDGELDYFVLRGSSYARLQPDGSGILRSEVFPGLWLDAQALLRGDMAQVLDVLQHGLTSPEHEAFPAGLMDDRP